ncbi:glycosyltransferase family 9 protein [Roseomonas sp. CCTCC AB2023176]|uniref:glycosyltransferase family 9 protein n=1 Tax=Roseomonas sp. CCTCC AB2023176 TaxID=3342640 RepID=UPI0035D55F06
MTAPATVGVFSGGETYGDAIYKVMFLRALRHAFPSARLVWFTAESTLYARSLQQAAGPPLLDEVRECCGVGAGPISVIRPIPAGLGPFELLLDTQSVLWRTYVVQRIPHDRFISAAFMRYSLDRRTHILDRLFALIERATGEKARRDLSPLAVPTELRAAAYRALPKDATHYVGFAPGAGGVQKIWPLDRFLAVASGVVETGRTPVFLLGPNEAVLRPEIAARLPNAEFPLQHPAWDTVGGPLPMATVALAGRLAAAVSNDSGTGHMIAAGGAPLVSLFGPSDPAKFRPVASRALILRAQDHGGKEMTHLPVEAVRAALDSLLSGTWGAG